MNMRRIIGLFVSALMLCAPAESFAQESGVDVTVSADFVSQYIWRGLHLGDISVQPTFGVSYKGLSLTAWGSVGASKADDKEFDLTLAYTVGGFNVGVTDYWFDNGQDELNRYFLYDAHKTNHVFEANVGYDFGLVNLQWYTYFAGYDGTNKSGKRAYSSYFEAGVPFKFASVDWNATLGIVPYYTTAYDGAGFSVTNLSLRAAKDIKVTDSFSIPVFGEVTANPYLQKAYLVFGLTLQP